MGSAARLGYPSGREAALDFGCGVGRLTRALAKDFRRCYGVDISESMIAKARELNQSLPGCEFVLNTQGDLALFPDNHFDMIYTCRVLQHLPSRATIKLHR
jgi:ubiquinone/menaquinone biosynthesis C-methylase UbiE